MLFAGIDVSKDHFDVFFQEENKQFKNQPEGFEALKTWLLAVGEPVQVVLESTGPYYLKLAWFLYENSIPVSVINPQRSRRYAQALTGGKTKTDQVDARLLAHFGTHHQPPCWQPPKAIDTALKQWDGLRQLLDSQRLRLQRQCQAFALDPQCAEEVLALQQAQIQHLDGQIKALDKKVDALVKQHYAELNKVLRTIPGIGPRAAAILLATTAGFTRFENAKQLASYVGIAPRVIQSGKMKMRSVSICKMGQGRLRQILYMAAISASQHNPGCKALFQRLTQRGKPFKVALIAVAHKLLRQTFSVARFNQPFDPKLSLAQRTPNPCIST